MATERTLSIVKPDAVEKNHTGAILALLEKEGFRIVALRRTHLSLAVAQGFYAVHKERGFFGELVQFMTRSPVVIAVLEKDDAVASYRKVMGATDPAKADAGTIRKLFGANMGENATHGSDSAYFFAASEIA
jgi:nucleoside-diphosphate kinase